MHDEEDGYRRRREEEAERYRDEDGRHRRHLDGVAVRVQARAAHVVRVEHTQEDGYVAADKDGERQHAEGEQVDPRPGGATERDVARFKRGASTHGVGQELYAHVLVRPEEVCVQGTDDDGNCSHCGDGVGSCAQSLRVVRQEHGDQPLYRDGHQQPRLVLGEAVQQERVCLTRERRYLARVILIIDNQPLPEQTRI